ncbi:hypothetical protein R1sor_009060 [Riccia sorocarpa]|uniref:Uncharacterized protein n=1 Tax=Riccia sorocarpa TaxID=122646 RepID=A0ABD3H8P5_9MARC
MKRMMARPYRRPHLLTTENTRPECATGLSPIFTPVRLAIDLESPEVATTSPTTTSNEYGAVISVQDEESTVLGITEVKQEIGDRVTDYGSPVTPECGYSDIVGKNFVPPSVKDVEHEEHVPNTPRLAPYSPEYTRRAAQDFELIPCSDGVAVVNETYYIARWNLKAKTVHVSEQASHDGRVQSFHVPKLSGQWTLQDGRRYKVYGIRSVCGQDIPLPFLPDDTPDSSVVEPPNVDEGASCTMTTVIWPGIPKDPLLVSTFDALKQIRGKSELSRLQLSNFKHMAVRQLPDKYNGDVVFELPPKNQEEVQKKDGVLDGMDRTHDCWIWTRCTTTSAAIAQTEPLVQTPIVINGDIRKTKKRNSSYSARIDTHRPDKVARTEQMFRFHRGRLQFGPELDISVCGEDTNTETLPNSHEKVTRTDKEKGKVDSSGGISRPMSRERVDTFPTPPPATVAGVALVSSAPLFQTQTEPVTRTDKGKRKVDSSGGISRPMSRERVDTFPTPTPARVAGVASVSSAPPFQSQTEAVTPDGFRSFEERYGSPSALWAEFDSQDIPSSRDNLQLGDSALPLEPATVAGFTGGTVPASEQATTRENLPNGNCPSPSEPATLAGFTVGTDPGSEQATTRDNLLPENCPSTYPATLVGVREDVSSSDVEILESTPRRRPPTRGCPLFRENHPTIAPIPKQFGIDIVESDVDEKVWHLSRTKYAGAGPACFTDNPGRLATRSLCKTKIRPQGTLVVESESLRLALLEHQRIWEFNGRIGSGFVPMVVVIMDPELLNADLNCQFGLNLFLSSVELDLSKRRSIFFPVMDLSLFQEEIRSLSNLPLFRTTQREKFW